MKKFGCLASVLFGVMLFPGAAQAVPITATSASDFCAAFDQNALNIALTQFLQNSLKISAAFGNLNYFDAFAFQIRNFFRVFT